MKNLNQLKLVSFLLICFFGSGTFSQTTYDYTGTIELYTVPAGVFSISIQAYGAQGGNDNGGLGAGIYGEFAVTPGQELSIVVGQRGTVNNCGGPDASGGGGGGSFVWEDEDATLPWVAAGGGGGGNQTWGGDCTNGLPGQAGEDGTSGGSGVVPGGSGGMGGASLIAGNGAGGGGWLTPGLNAPVGDFDESATGGWTIPLFAGGMGAPTYDPGGEGGYGGGGGATCGCGGGGGYSGGAGGYSVGCRSGGGGGGSYNGGTAQENETGVRMGNGQVIITELCAPLTVTASETEICLGESFTLTASGVGSIEWDGGVINGEPFIPDEAGVTTYTASSDADGDCGFSIDIEVLGLPDIALFVDDSEICDGDSVSFTLDSDLTEHTWEPETIEPDTYYFPTLTTKYFVFGTDDETGCENSDSVQVTVNPLPDVSAEVDDNEICLGDEITLTATGATTYEWDPETIESGVAFAPGETGITTYTVVGTDDNGCTNTDDVVVAVYDALELSFTVTDEVAGGDGAIDLTVSGGNPAYVFDWDNDGTGDFDDEEDLTGLFAGTYNVVVMDDAGCSISESVSVDGNSGITDFEIIFNVYPNPFEDILTIQGEGEFSYSISTVSGQYLFGENIQDKVTLSLEEYAEGTYLLNIKSENGSERLLIVKQ